MRLSQPALALLSLPTVVLAVSLGDFTPRVSNLPAKCQSVYTQTITGCSPSDFTSGCSKGCVLALQALTAPVTSACANQGVQGENIIVAFLSGSGPQSLCTDAQQVLNANSGASASTSASPMTSTSALSSSAVSTTSATSSTSSSTLPTSSTDTTDSSTTAMTVSSTSTSTAHASSTPSSHGNRNGNDGGGSPFDTSASSAAAVSFASVAVTLFSAGFLVAAVLR